MFTNLTFYSCQSSTTLALTKEFVNLVNSQDLIGSQFDEALENFYENLEAVTTFEELEQISMELGLA